MIVEDEQDIREAMLEALSEDGFRVVTAANGEDGLQAAHDTHPDLILLDIRMPVMDGLEMLSELRKDEWGKDAKVIVMTAMDDVNNIASAHSAKLEDYLIKTHTSLDELVKLVRMNVFA